MRGRESLWLLKLGPKLLRRVVNLEGPEVAIVVRSFGFERPALPFDNYVTALQSGCFPPSRVG